MSDAAENEMKTKAARLAEDAAGTGLGASGMFAVDLPGFGWLSAEPDQAPDWADDVAAATETTADDVDTL